MASAIIRYVWKGIKNADLEGFVPGSALPIVVGEIVAAPQIDIQIADIAAKEDLDSVMASLNWDYLSTNPPNSPDNKIELSATTVGAATAILLDPNGQEFMLKDGLSYIVTTRTVGARIDAPGAAQSGLMITSLHVDSGNITIDDSAVITTFGGVNYTTPGGLVLRGEVTGVAGQTIQWNVIYEWLTAAGAP